MKIEDLKGIMQLTEGFPLTYSAQKMRNDHFPALVAVAEVAFMVNRVFESVNLDSVVINKDTCDCYRCKLYRALRNLESVSPCAPSAPPAPKVANNISGE
jgi:hypothetical protein